MSRPILLSLAHMSGKEEQYIREAFETNWVVPLGPNVDGFEKDLENWLSAKADRKLHVVALSAGTAAIHLALVMLDVQPGDEVICQSFTFSASANPICYQGAVPVFVDSEPGSWNMDPVLLEEAILDRQKKTGKLPKAIIPVHLYGTPARMNEICAVAQKYGIPVVEDSAEAQGSVYDGRYCGTLGTYGILSFNGNKMITTSGGGALICPTKEAADRVKFYATQAREKFPWYQHEKIGYNYRLSNISAGIGRGQMTVLDAHIAHRRAIHARYVEELKGLPGIEVMQPKADAETHPNYWLSTLLVHPEEAGIGYQKLADILKEKQIETRPLWKPLHLQPVFKDAPKYINGISEKKFKEGLCLPSGPMVSRDDQSFIIETIRQTIQKNN